MLIVYSQLLFRNNSCISISLIVIFVFWNIAIRRGERSLHTVPKLDDSQIDLVLKVLIFDDEKRRVKRAMQQEGFSEKSAGDYIQRHDEKVSGWTNFLFQKQAYDQSLYDVVLPLNNKNPTDITLEVIEYFNNMASWQTPFQANAALPVLEKYMSMGEQIGAY